MHCRLKSGAILRTRKVRQTRTASQVQRTSMAPKATQATSKKRATETSERTQTAGVASTDRAIPDGSAERARRPDPVPEQQPWRSDADVKGWRTVYRGDGQPRPVASSVVVELT